MKIDPYNFELYRFKVGAFFLRHSVVTVTHKKMNKKCAQKCNHGSRYGTPLLS